METLLIYLGKVALSIATFYMLYVVLFRQHKQFRFNRLYLSGSLFLSFIIPLITINITRPATRQFVILPETGTEFSSAVSNGQNGLDFHSLLLFLYFGVVILFSLRLVTGQLRVYSIIRRCRKAVITGTCVFITQKDVYPFTFFRKIVISESTLSHPDLKMILNHEKVHAEEKHTLDILLSEVLFLFQWFNPLAWKQKEAVKNNLEFLADQIVIQRSDMQTYQMAMVSMAGKQGIARFLNALNGNDLKNRIIMMKKKTENRNKTIRQLAVLPLMVILILGLSNKEFKAAPDVNQIQKFTELNQASEDLIAGDSVKKVKKDIIVVGYPAGKSSADTVKTRIKSNGSNIWTISKADGQKSTGVAMGTTEKNDNKEVVVIGYGMKMDGENFSGDSIRVRTNGNKQGVEPIYILDGKEIKSLDGVNPESIESISVLKNESATALYGEKGKNGVILITSKKQKSLTGDPLIIVDGKESEISMNDIDPKEIASVNVLKGESAITRYGKKGENGAVEITLKIPREELSSPITTADQLRKRIAQNIRYPKIAQENGEQSVAKVYAFINGEGAITQITTMPSANGFQKLDEVVVVGYCPNSVSPKEVENSSSIVQEATLMVKKLPELNIAGFKNTWVEFQFNFRLEKPQGGIRLR